MSGGWPTWKRHLSTVARSEKTSGEKKNTGNTLIFHEKPQNGPLSHCKCFDSNSHWKQDLPLHNLFSGIYSTALKSSVTFTSEVT